MISVAEVFNIAKSTVNKCIKEVIIGLCELSSKFIFWPNLEEAKAVEDKFKNKGQFPGVIGCIGGLHFTIKASADQEDCYTDRKLNKSIIMQGVCTSDYIFTNVNVGFLGRVHDARVFSNCKLYKMIDTNGSNSLVYGKYHLLGDLAYANTNWLITPYKNYGSLTVRHKTFNTKLNKTRVCIEHSFGLLKGRW